MAEVWIAYRGEYEQECAVGVFASLELLIGAFPSKKWHWADYANGTGRWLEGPCRVECHEVVDQGPTAECTKLRQSLPRIPGKAPRHEIRTVLPDGTDPA